MKSLALLSLSLVIASCTACPWLAMHPEAMNGATPPPGHERLLSGAARAQDARNGVDRASRSMYSIDSDYQSMSASAKMDYLWSKITANTTSGPWAPGMQFDAVMNETMTDTLQVSQRVALA